MRPNRQQPMRIEPAAPVELPADAIAHLQHAIASLRAAAAIVEPFLAAQPRSGETVRLGRYVAMWKRDAVMTDAVLPPAEG